MFYLRMDRCIYPVRLRMRYWVYRSTAEAREPWEFVMAFSFEDGQQGCTKDVTYDPSAVFKSYIPSGGFENVGVQ